MTLWFEYKSRVAGLGKSIDVDIEAVVVRDKIEHLSVYCNEKAVGIPFLALPQIDQDEIITLVWAKVAAEERSRADRHRKLCDDVFNLTAENNYELVKSLNASRGVR